MLLAIYSKHNPDVGYVQGMNFILGAILYNLNSINYKDLLFSFG
jgi:hypothetical protein